VRVHTDCGGEVVIIPDGYICAACGEQSFSDILSEAEQERAEYEHHEREQGQE
jgi:hypothetical protein